MELSSMNSVAMASEPQKGCWSRSRVLERLIFN
jgi:hypothetical protein